MAVSRGNDDARKDRSRWDNLTKQTVRLQTEFDGTQGGGLTLYEDYANIEPAGGIDRGKVMELVRLRIGNQVYAFDTADGVSRAWADYELTTAPESHFLAEEDATHDTDVDGVTGHELEVFEEEEDPGTLDVWKATAFTAFEDHTNGTGGGADMTQYENTINYRDEYGITGPLFDVHDMINLHARIFTSSNIDLESSITLHLDWLEWQVEEDLDNRLQPC